MKKIQVLILMALMTWVPRVYAADYPYLVFKATDGTTTLLNVSQLSIQVSGSTLQVANAEGSVNFSLTDLYSMYFSVDSSLSALETVIDGNEPIEAVSLTGVRMGWFPNMVSATRALPKGVYVITNGKRTQKMIVQ